MPTNYIKSLVDKGKGTKAELEKKWSAAKKKAASEGHKDEYDYITGIFNKMIGEATTSASIATYPMGGGNASSNKGKRKKKLKKNNNTIFKDFYVQFLEDNYK